MQKKVRFDIWLATLLRLTYCKNVDTGFGKTCSATMSEVGSAFASVLRLFVACEETRRIMEGDVATTSAFPTDRDVSSFPRESGTVSID